MVEYLSPNTNKPLHLGHVRNGALGMAVARLYEAAGCKTIKANLVNDRGVPGNGDRKTSSDGRRLTDHKRGLTAS